MSEGLKRSQPERWSRRRRREEATKHAIEAWLEVEGGFTRGDLRSEITLNSFYSNEEAYTMCPMAFACDRALQLGALASFVHGADHRPRTYGC